MFRLMKSLGFKNKKPMKTFLVSLLLLFMCEMSISDTTLHNWNANSVTGIDSGLDKVVYYSGNTSAYIYSDKDHHSQKYKMWQSIIPCPVQSKIYRISAHLKTANVKRSGMSVTIYGRDGRTIYEDISDETYGTTPWTLFEKIIELPKNCFALNVGFYLIGKGKVWADEFDLVPAKEHEEANAYSSYHEYTERINILSGGFEE